jgi:hypothetical protein
MGDVGKSRRPLIADVVITETSLQAGGSRWPVIKGDCEIENESGYANNNLHGNDYYSHSSAPSLTNFFIFEFFVDRWPIILVIQSIFIEHLRVLKIIIKTMILKKPNCPANSTTIIRVESRRSLQNASLSIISAISPFFSYAQ